MVKVLPEPVTPSSTWSGLIACRDIIRDNLEMLADVGAARARQHLGPEQRFGQAAF